MKSKPILIVPAVFVLVIAGLSASLPGGNVEIYLAGAALSLWPVGFSGGWPKYVGLMLCLTFLILTGYESRAGIEWGEERFRNQLKRIQTGNNPAEIPK